MGSGTNHFAGIHLLGKIGQRDEQNLPKSDRYWKRLQKKPASLRTKKHEKIILLLTTKNSLSLLSL